MMQSSIGELQNSARAAQQALMRCSLDHAKMLAQMHRKAQYHLIQCRMQLAQAYADEANIGTHVGHVA
eukprot:10681096-Karenia_brevis.AAC.1